MKRYFIGSLVLSGIFLTLACGGPANAQLTLPTEQSDAETAAVRRINVLLARTIEQPFEAGTLGELIARVKQQGIPVIADTNALDDEGLDLSSKTAAAPAGIQLKSALRLSLMRTKLTWVIRDEVLQITTFDAAESRLATRVYNVSGLLALTNVTDYSGANYRARDFDSLISLITSHIEPSSWDEVGGPGAIEAIELNGNGLLVVSQTDVAFEKLDRLLRNLHRHSSRPNAGGGGASSTLRSTGSQIPSSGSIRSTGSPQSKAPGVPRTPFF